MKRIKVCLMLIAAMACVAIPSFAPTKKLYRTKMTTCDGSKFNGTSVVSWYAATVDVTYVVRGFDVGDEIGSIQLYVPELGSPGVIYELCGGDSGTECPDLQIDPQSVGLYVSDTATVTLNSLLSPPLPTPGKKAAFFDYLDNDGVYMEVLLGNGSCKSKGGPYDQIFP